ncbi:MAG: peptidyl-prolyl cis-trans isomerase [Pyrinomonadaceae bacterium]|nr:peptidyl-prolyl cis-trans isomerase [Pyrinomonadaceae bacterium]
MLKQFGRMKRTRNWLIVAFALFMGLSLILFYAPSRNTTATAATSTEVMAEVAGDDITVGDVERLKEVYRERFGGQFDLAQLGLNNKGLLNGLIRDRVVALEARRVGLGVSDQEVAGEIRQQMVDESGKFVGLERYKEVAASRAGSVARFEQQMRDSIAAQKLEAFVTAGVKVSEEEVLDDFKRKGAELALIYVPVTPDQLIARVQPSDEELQKYFDEHKTDFRFLEPQKKVRYLFVDQAKVGEKLDIPDADLRAAYDALAPENKQAGVKVQQIVLRVARPDLDASVLEKANNLVKETRGESGNATEEKFAEIARGNSEDPATAKNGGGLAGFVRKNLNRPDDPLQRTLDMTPGQVSEPIKYQNAYYIFRRGESVPKSFEEAKTELLVSQRNTRAYRTAAQLAERAVQRIKETKDFQKVAQELAAEANMKPEEMIRETPLVKPGDDVPNVGSNPQFEEAIRPLENAGDIGDRVSIKGGFAVPLLMEKREPRIPDFAEVKDQVASRFKEERARQQLEQTARELANSAGSAADLTAAAEKLGLKAQTEEKYKLGSPLGAAGTSPAADDAIYALKDGEVTKTPIKVGDTWVVVGATKRTEADLSEFTKQQQTLTDTMLQTRQSQVFQDYVTVARGRMEKAGDVKIYQDVLDRASADEEPPVAAPGFGGGGGVPFQMPSGQ